MKPSLHNYIFILRKTALLLFFFLFSAHVFSQDIIFELPVVGDTIDNAEKPKYLLFDNIPNDDFLFAVIYRRGNDTLITHFKKSDTVETKINDTYISSILYNVYKLDAYYTSIENPDDDITGKSVLTNPDKKAESELEATRMDKALKQDPNYKPKKSKKDKKQEAEGSYNTTAEKNTLKYIRNGAMENNRPPVLITK